MRARECACYGAFVTSPDAWIDLIIAKAPALRAAGVTTLTLEGVTITLSPAEPNREAVEAMPQGAFDGEDPLAHIPGFTRPSNEVE